MDTDRSGQDPAALATLTVRKGAGAAAELIVPVPAATVGKGNQNDVVLDDDSVSTRHARLEHEGGAWRVTDLGSANGTFVEGLRIAAGVPTPLGSGASIRLGAVEMHFRPAPDAHPDAARAASLPPRPRDRATDRRTPPRFPLWLLLLLILAIAAIWFGLVWTPEPAEPPTVPGDGAVGALIGVPPSGRPV